jgi:hypothetical protein
MPLPVPSDVWPAPPVTRRAMWGRRLQSVLSLVLAQLGEASLRYAQSMHPELMFSLKSAPAEGAPRPASTPQSPKGNRS